MHPSQEMLTESGNPVAETGEWTPQLPINDRLIRIIGIPFFGIIIPLLTGLYGPHRPSSPIFWAGLAYFIFTSWAIWEGNRAFLIWQRRYYDWFDHPARKVLLLLAANIFYTGPLTVGLMAGWYKWAGFAAPNWATIQTVTLMCVICVIFITHIYETVYLIQQRESDQLRVAKLERARAEAELDALRAQIDPHFMFNSLNTMSWLIENSPKDAAAFNQNLADVYRYILMHKSRELVLLADEFEFVGNYFSLLKLRFGDGIRMSWNVPAEAQSRFLLPPISLQLLVENAVKHNEFTEQKPLDIGVRLENSELIVENSRRLRPPARVTARTGLRNLDERYRLLAGRGITVEQNDDVFCVRIPLLDAEQT